MKLLYLYVESFRNLKRVGFNLDSNERFHYDGHSLEYKRFNILPDNFFCIEDTAGVVESVSAIVGENGSGKTSFATLLNYLFVLGRPYPRYICVCKIDGNYIAFDNLESTPNDNQVRDVLGEKWDYRSKTLHRDTEGCPFEVLYYSPFMHTRFVWNDRNKWCHDISAAGSLNAAIGKVMDGYFDGASDTLSKRNSAPDSPIECMDHDLNIARIEFLHKFATLPDEKRTNVPFPLPLTMEIKPNIELFVDFESYLHSLFKESELNPEMRKNVNVIANLKGYYTTRDPFRQLLIAFVICMAQELGYENLGYSNCPEILDLTDLCRLERCYEELVRMIESGWDEHGRHVNPDTWVYVDNRLLCKLLKLWKRFQDGRETETLGGGVHVSLQNEDSKKDIIDLLHIQARLLAGRREPEAFVPLARRRFIATDPAGMSSGECSYLNLFALFYQRIQSVLSRIERPLLVAVDEAETTLHPGWQRQMVYNVIWFFENFVRGCSVHVIFMTHSPMLLSDIPIWNCVFLSRDDGMSRIENIGRNDAAAPFLNTFGANIFDMYYHPFFMKEGTIGKFALRKIEKVLLEKKAEDRWIVKIVGDPFLRGILLDEFGEEDVSDNGISNSEFSNEPNIEYPQE